MFIFMTLHYPSPDNVQALAQGMAQMRGWMESQPGCLGVEPPLVSEDGTCLVGFSRWESKEAFLATGIDLDSLGETPTANFDRGNHISSPPRPTAPPEDYWLGVHTWPGAVQEAVCLKVFGYETTTPIEDPAPAGETPELPLSAEGASSARS